MTTRILGIFLALSLSAFADGPSGAKLTGKIEALPAGGTVGNWTVAGRTVQVTASTKIDRDDAPLAVGTCVDVKGTTVSATVIAAEKIDTRPAAKCNAVASPPVGSVEIFGSIDQLPTAGLVGDWRVGGTLVRVTAQTRIEQERGPAVVGACVEVEGTRNTDNSIAAAKIEVKSGIGGCRGNDDNEKPQIEFRGLVQTAPAAGSTQWVISGRKVLILPNTDIRPNLRSLSVGDCVEVEGKLGTDVIVTASKIQILGNGVCRNALDNQADLSFYGLITALPAGSGPGDWTVGAMLVKITASTRLLDGPFTTGKCVEVKGDFATGNVINATRIEGQAASRCAAPGPTPGGAPPAAGQTVFEGTVELVPAGAATGVATGAWRVGGRNVTADANTSLNVSKGLALPGSCVRVTGNLQADSSIRATAIEVLAAGGACILTGGVVNAASLSGFGVSPAQIISIFGRNIGPATEIPLQIEDGKVSNNLKNTKVLFDGTPASILFASQGQINAIVPCGVAGKAQTVVQVESNGAWSNTMTLPVFPAYPSIFTLSNSGTGRGAILNSDATVNSPSNALARGAAGSLYATGEGQTAPACQDGQIIPAAGPYPTPILPVEVEVGGRPAAITFKSGAPGLVRGVIQVNFIPAADTPTGPNVPIVLKIGGRASQDGVTIAIR